MSEASLFIYVNGAKYDLLKDGRFSLRPYFPEATTLLDARYVPAKEVAIELEGPDRGITKRKLLPCSSYQAFFTDINNGTLYPYTPPVNCIYVLNLRPTVNPMTLGKSLENYDFVVSADIYHSSGNTCDGRGWVILKDPKNYARVPAQLFDLAKDHPAYVQFSNVQPSSNPFLSHERMKPRYTVPDAKAGPPSALLAAGQQPKANMQVPQPRSMRPQDPHPALEAPTPIGAPPALPPLRYFIAKITHDEAPRILRQSEYRTLPQTEDTLHGATYGGGKVILIFLVDDTIFGIAELVRQEGWRPGDGCRLSWLESEVYLPSRSLPAFPSMPRLFSLETGAALSETVGSEICRLVEQAARPSRPPPPTSAPIHRHRGPPGPPYGNPRGGYGHQRGGGGPSSAGGLHDNMSRSGHPRRKQMYPHSSKGGEY